MLSNVCSVPMFSLQLLVPNLSVGLTSCEVPCHVHEDFCHLGTFQTPKDFISVEVGHGTQRELVLGHIP